MVGAAALPRQTTPNCRSVRGTGRADLPHRSRRRPLCHSVAGGVTAHTLPWADDAALARSLIDLLRELVRIPVAPAATTMAPYSPPFRAGSLRAACRAKPSLPTIVPSPSLRQDRRSVRVRRCC
jgi:hypothetical protein